MTLKFGHLSLVGFFFGSQKEGTETDLPQACAKRTSYSGCPATTAKNLWLRQCLSICVSESRSALCGSAPSHEGLSKSSAKPRGRFFSRPGGLWTSPSPWDLHRTRLCRAVTALGGRCSRLARSARRRTRLRSHPAHPKPTASTPGSLQALLFLQGMLREPSPSDAPSFWLPGVRGASTKNRTQTPRHTVLCRSWSQRLPVTG